MGKMQGVKGADRKVIAIPIGFRLFFATLPVGIVVWVLSMRSTWPAEGRAMWTGFDLAMLALPAAAAGYTVAKQSRWACPPLATLAAMFTVDMYFDCWLSASSHSELTTALILGTCLELPLAGLCLWCMLIVFRQLSPKNLRPL